MKYKHIMFSGHAIHQMFSRSLQKNDIIAVIRDGQIVIDYPNDKPYPSYLMLGFVKNLPIHVIFAVDQEQQIAIVITTYIPDTKLWSEDFKSRRKN